MRYSDWEQRMLDQKYPGPAPRCWVHGCKLSPVAGPGEPARFCAQHNTPERLGRERCKLALAQIEAGTFVPQDRFCVCGAYLDSYGGCLKGCDADYPDSYEVGDA